MKSLFKLPAKLDPAKILSADLLPAKPHKAKPHKAKSSSKSSGKSSGTSSGSSFTELRAVDNFYQTSLYFPMPAVLVSTLTDEGKTTCGPYSLLAPFYVAGKEYYAFMLECRNSSNTAQNLIKHKKCVINFLDDDRKTFKEMVRLGWPGDTPAEKMKDFARRTPKAPIPR